METKKIPKELRLLKRSIIGSGVFGMLLPLVPQMTDQGNSPVLNSVGSVLLLFAAIHLSYLRRLEKRLVA